MFIKHPVQGQAHSRCSITFPCTKELSLTPLPSWVLSPLGPAAAQPIMHQGFFLCRCLSPRLQGHRGRGSGFHSLGLFPGLFRACPQQNLRKYSGLNRCTPALFISHLHHFGGLGELGGENREMSCKHLIGNIINSTSHTLGIKERQGFEIRQTEVKSQLSHYLCDLVTCLFLPQFPEV